MIDSSEIWKEVQGYEGLYRVSSLGRVFSFPRSGTKGGLVAEREGKSGYVHVKICKDDSYKSIAVHRLVAFAFHGSPPDGFECAHLNGIRKDNRAVNLIWASRTENQSHRELHGTKCIGEKNHFSKISEETAKEILAMKKPRTGPAYRNSKYNTSQVEVAEMFGVSRQLVSGIWTGRIWGHLNNYHTNPAPNISAQTAA